jgi:serine/threonine protein kinase
MQKLCPQCFNMFPTTADTCPEDGAQLVMPVDQDLTGKVVNEKYEVLDRIGEGGMGYVYRARHLRLQREVALKVLRAEIVKDRTVVQRFLNEARASASLTSPHTITLHDFGVSKEGFLFYEMELLAGRSVAQLIKEEAPLAPDVAARIVLQACDSLEEAHKKGILHRDIKPDNLFVARSGNKEMVKVLDFGIAKMLGESKFESELTSAGTIIGTPQYLSPEQACGDEVGPASDLYSLAIVLYELVTGRPPFKEKTPILTMAAHIRSPMPPLSSWDVAIPRSEALQAFLTRALDKVASYRFSSAADFRTALLEAVGETESSLVTPAGASASRGEATQQWDTASVKVVLENAPPPPSTTVRETVDPHGATEFHETSEEDRKAVEQARSELRPPTPPPADFDFDEPTLDAYPPTSGSGRRGLLVGFVIALVLVVVGLVVVFGPASSETEDAHGAAVQDTARAGEPDVKIPPLGQSATDLSSADPEGALDDAVLRDVVVAPDQRPADLPGPASEIATVPPDGLAAVALDAGAELAGAPDAGLPANEPDAQPIADAQSGPVEMGAAVADGQEDARLRARRKAERQAREIARRDALARKAAEEAAQKEAENTRKAAEAARLIAAAKAQALEVEGLTDAARKAKASGGYDRCMAQAGRALKLDPGHAQAKALLQDCQKRKQEEQNALDGIKIDDSSALDGMKTN